MARHVVREAQVTRGLWIFGLDNVTEHIYTTTYEQHLSIYVCSFCFMYVV
jgi:hypothetical protein